ncbi:MAG: vesicle coat component [Caeruleum heppii]|nr:MAG: vesicle coat component [Caeruleum heppii]
MTSHRPLSALLASLLLLLITFPFSSALKFDLQAFPAHNKKSERCIRNFVSKDTLVVVTATVSGSRGDGQTVNMHVSRRQSRSRIERTRIGKATCIKGHGGWTLRTRSLTTWTIQIKDAVGNEYGRPRDVAGEQRMAFTSHADSAFDVCFENLLTSQSAVMNPTRHIELDIDIGADARDWSAIQAAEKLKPVETELRRIEELVAEIVTEMDYLRSREQKLRDTNESTNERVKWFAFGTMGMLLGLGAWQIVYLRAYFRSKHLI